jgi:hypothetical protein
MRRILIGVAVAAVTAAGLASPAAAAPGKVTTENSTVALAEGYWNQQLPGEAIVTYVETSSSAYGRFLRMIRWDYTLDAAGNPVADSTTFVETATGFTQSIDAKKLTVASVHGVGLAATTTYHDGDGNEVGSTVSTLDLDVSWVGDAGLTHGRAYNVNDVVPDAFRMIVHNNDVFRDAAATATIDGHTLSADSFFGADIASIHVVTVTVCAKGLTSC